MGNKPDIKQSITLIENMMGDPHKGLPDEVFLFVSRITPMINVDLLIKNERNQTLLTWRDDGYWEPGWHIPGGIIRYKEKIADRIQAVASIELGTVVVHQAAPLAINEFVQPVRKDRGHFVSLLYRCTLLMPPDENLRFESGTPRPNQWKWHDNCPENIISVHELYRQYI